MRATTGVAVAWLRTDHTGRRRPAANIAPMHGKEQAKLATALSEIEVFVLHACGPGSIEEAGMIGGDFRPRLVTAA